MDLYVVSGCLDALGIFPVFKDRRFLRVGIFQLIGRDHLFTVKQDCVKEISKLSDVIPVIL